MSVVCIYVVVVCIYELDVSKYVHNFQPGKFVKIRRPVLKKSMPFFDLRIMTKAIPLAFAIMLLSVLEVISIGRTYHRAKDPPYRENQEIYGLGVSNFLCSFLGALPVSGSFSRSRINYTAGAKTTLSAVLSGIFVLAIVLSLGFLVTKIPFCYGAYKGCHNLQGSIYQAFHWTM